MSVAKKIKRRRKNKQLVVRNRLRRTTDLPRVSVFRSINQIYAQIIDDAQHKTVASCSSLALDAKGTKTEVATAVGTELAKRALEQGVKKVCFDRGRFLFHGRVKALADGLRAGGVEV